MDNQEQEKYLIEAIKMKESGKNEAEILSAFGEKSPKIKGELELMNFLEKEGRKIEAPRHILSNVMSKVTSSEPNRYLYGKRGRTFFELLTNSLTFMTNKAYVGIALVVLAFVVVLSLVVGGYNPFKEGQPAENQETDLAVEVAAAGTDFDAEMAELEKLTSDEAFTNIETEFASLSTI